MHRHAHIPTPHTCIVMEYTNPHMHSHAHTYICIDMHKHIALHTQSCIHTHRQTHTYTNRGMHKIQIHIQRHAHTNTHIHRYAHMQIFNDNVFFKNQQKNTFLQITLEEMYTIINCTIPLYLCNFLQLYTYLL